MKKTAVIVVAVVALIVLALAGTALAANGNNPVINLALADPTPTAQGYAGITISDINASVQQRLNLSQSSGVVIVTVAANSPAATAGLQRGDVITAINGTNVATAQDVTSAISKLAPGSAATFNVTRGAQTMAIQVTLGSKPATPAKTQAFAGITVANITAEIAQQLNLSQTAGVVITQVSANSAAATAGLQRGDVITAINGTNVATAQDVTNLVGKLNPGDKATFSITRGAQTMSVDVTLGTRSAATKGRGLPSDLQSLLQGLRGLAQDQLFSHNLGSTRTLKDADGNTVTIYTIPGVVSAVSASSITLTPNNPQSSGGPFSIDATTVILIPGTPNATADSIKVGDKVVVVTIGTTNHASSISEAGLNGLGGGMWGGFDGFRGRGMGPHGFPKITTPNGNRGIRGNGNGIFKNFPGGQMPTLPKATPVPGGSA